MFELLRIVERFATDFDELPELIVGCPEYRELIADVLMPRISVVGQLAADGAVELVELRRAGIPTRNVRPNQWTR